MSRRNAPGQDKWRSTFCNGINLGTRPVKARYGLLTGFVGIDDTDKTSSLALEEPIQPPLLFPPVSIFRTNLIGALEAFEKCD